MKKKIMFVFAILSLITVTACGNPKLKNGDEIIAKIDGKEFTAEELYEELKVQYGYNVVIGWIDAAIADKEVKTTKEIEEYVDEAIEFYTYYAESYGMTLPNFAASYLGISGIESEDDLRKYIETDRKLTMAIINKIAEKIKDKDVEEYYNNNYKTPYTYYEILIQNDDSSEEIIEEIMEKLDDKEDDELIEEFEKLAEKYSISASAENGGIVKSATKNQVDKDVWETLEDLDKYELSEEIETENGIYIVIKKSEDKPKELKKVKTEIKEAMAQEKLESDQFLSYDTLTALRNEYKVAFFDKDLKDMYNDFLDEVETTKEQANTEKED